MTAMIDFIRESALATLNRAALRYSPKPRNWRTYYGYRPTVPAPAADDYDRQKAREKAYCKWLAKQRGWEFEEARDYAQRQVQPKTRHRAAFR